MNYPRMILISRIVNHFTTFACGLCAGKMYYLWRMKEALMPEVYTGVTMKVLNNTTAHFDYSNLFYQNPGWWTIGLIAFVILIQTVNYLLDSRLFVTE